MGKTQIIIDPNNNKESLKKIINGTDAVNTDWSNVKNFFKPYGLKQSLRTTDDNGNLQNIIIISGSNKADYNSHASQTINLETKDFTLKYDFSLEKYEYNNPFTNKSERSTLFYNTCGFLHIEVFGKYLYISYRGQDNSDQYIGGSGPSGFSGKSTVFESVDKNKKYRIIISRIYDKISATLFDITSNDEGKKIKTASGNITRAYDYGYDDDENPPLLRRKSLDTTNSYSGWHTSRIGNCLSFSESLYDDMLQTDGNTCGYMNGWIHYFELTIEDPLPILKYEPNPISIFTFSVKKETYEKTPLLTTKFHTQENYDNNNLLKIKFSNKKENRPYDNDMIINFSVKKETYEKTPLLTTKFAVQKKYNNNNLLKILFNLPVLPDDPGDVQYFNDTYYNNKIMIGPFNDPTTIKETLRDLSDMKRFFKFELHRIIEKEEEPELPDIGTLDDGDVIFEIAHTNVFFMEIDPETNGLNLYRKDTLTSQSMLIASLTQVSGYNLNFNETWTHIAMTYDIKTNELIIFINGRKAYTTTDVKNLDWGYMQFNTFNTESRPTYFAGVTLTDKGNYTENFPIVTNYASFPLTPYASKVSIAKSVVLIEKITKQRIVFTGYVIPYKRQIVHVYTNHIPVTIKEKKLIFTSARINIHGYYIQTYSSLPHVPATWHGARIFGPLTSNPTTIPGKIIITPAHPKYFKGYSSIKRYAENWTLDFWYFKAGINTTDIVDILKVISVYGEFTLSTGFFASSFGGKTTNVSSTPYITHNTWMHMALVYEVKNSTLVIYINGKIVYNVYIRLASPQEIIFFIGTSITNGNYFVDIEMTNDPKYKTEFETNPEPETPTDPEPIVKPKNPGLTEIKNLVVREFKTRLPRDVYYLYDGLDDHTIDYRLMMYKRTTINSAQNHDLYSYDVNYTSSRLYNFKEIVVSEKLKDNWIEVRSMGPSESGTIGYIHYKSKNYKLNEYTIDFWVYKNNNDKAGIDYPLLDLLGSNNKIRIVMTDQVIQYYSYINNSWQSEILENSTKNNFINTWTHIAVTYDLPSKLLSVYVNGDKYVESSTFLSLPLEEMSIYTNTTEDSSQYITSIRISDINRFLDDEFNMDLVNHPYGNTYSACVPRHFQQIVFKGDKLDPTKRNVVIGTTEMPPTTLPIDPLSGEPIKWDKHGLPWSHTLRIPGFETKYNHDTYYLFIKKCYYQDIVGTRIVEYTLTEEALALVVRDFEKEFKPTNIADINFSIQPIQVEEEMNIAFKIQRDYIEEIFMINFSKAKPENKLIDPKGKNAKDLLSANTSRSYRDILSPVAYNDVLFINTMQKPATTMAYYEEPFILTINFSIISEEDENN